MLIYHEGKWWRASEMEEEREAQMLMRSPSALQRGSRRSVNCSKSNYRLLNVWKLTPFGHRKITSSYDRFFFLLLDNSSVNHSVYSSQTASNVSKQVAINAVWDKLFVNILINMDRNYQFCVHVGL